MSPENNNSIPSDVDITRVEMVVDYEAEHRRLMGALRQMILDFRTLHGVDDTAAVIEHVTPENEPMWVLRVESPHAGSIKIVDRNDPNIFEASFGDEGEDVNVVDAKSEKYEPQQDAIGCQVLAHAIEGLSCAQTQFIVARDELA